MRGLVHLEDRRGSVAICRAVQEHIETAKPLDRSGDGGTATRALGHVEVDGQRLRAASVDLGGGGPGARLLDVGARDRGAGRGER